MLNSQKKIYISQIYSLCKTIFILAIFVGGYNFYSAYKLFQSINLNGVSEPPPKLKILSIGNIFISIIYGIGICLQYFFLQKFLGNYSAEREINEKGFTSIGFSYLYKSFIVSIILLSSQLIWGFITIYL